MIKWQTEEASEYRIRKSLKKFMGSNETSENFENKTIRVQQYTGKVSIFRVSKHQDA
jgi:hypothetical protein